MPFKASPEVFELQRDLEFQADLHSRGENRKNLKFETLGHRDMFVLPSGDLCEDLEFYSRGSVFLGGF